MRSLCNGQLFALAALVLFTPSVRSQGDLLGKNRNQVVETLRSECRNHNCYGRKYNKAPIEATVLEIGDTVYYAIPGDDGLEHRFVFSADTCVALYMKFTCLACLHMAYRKCFFAGGGGGTKAGISIGSRILHAHQYSG